MVRVAYGDIRTEFGVVGEFIVAHLITGIHTSRMCFMKQLIILGFTFALTGCSSIAGTYLPDEIVTQSSKPSYVTEDGLIDLSELNLSEYNGASKQAERNELIAKAISLSDQKCTLHKAGILSNSNAWNVGSGTAAILFAGAASVVSHAQTASELAAAAAAVTGIQSIVNKEVYADALGTTILRSIDIGRTKKKAVIETGMANSNYSMSVALIDIQAYHNSCSLMAGLVEVTKAFDNRKPSRNELERDIAILKDEIKNIDSNLKGVDASIQKTIVDKYAEELKDKVLLLSAASE
jgi:hypothetical protein